MKKLFEMSAEQKEKQRRLVMGTALFYAKKEATRVGKKAAKKRTTLKEAAEKMHLRITKPEDYDLEQPLEEATVQDVVEETVAAEAKSEKVEAVVETVDGATVPVAAKVMDAAKEAEVAKEQDKSEDKKEEAPKAEGKVEATAEKAAEEVAGAIVKAAENVAEAAKKAVDKVQEAGNTNGAVAPAAAMEMPGNISGGSIVSKFVKPSKPEEKVNVSQMNGSGFVNTPAPVILTPPAEAGSGIDGVKAFLAQNPQIAPPVSMFPQYNINQKVAELKKTVTFIEGLHKGVDVIEIDCMLNTIKGPWLREKLRQNHASGVNNPKLVEVPIEKYDKTGNFNYAFEIDLKGSSKKTLVLLYQSVPTFNNGAWMNNTTLFTSKKANEKNGKNKQDIPEQKEVKKETPKAAEAKEALNAAAEAKEALNAAADAKATAEAIKTEEAPKTEEPKTDNVA